MRREASTGCAEREAAPVCRVGLAVVVVRWAAERAKAPGPLRGAKVELCPSVLGCKNAPFARSTTTEADGSFRFRDVPPGDFWIHVEVPESTRDCGGIFTVGRGGFVSIAACEANEARVYDLRPFRVCLPLEIPPRR